LLIEKQSQVIEKQVIEKQSQVGISESNIPWAQQMVQFSVLPK
jgi:hypothetical protein